MGLSEQWLAVRGDASGPVSASGMEFLGVHHGWTWARGWDVEDVDDLVPRLAREAEAAAIGGWVADSDCAYLVFATPAGEMGARVAINETLPFGEPVEGMADLWADVTVRSVAFASLATWSDRYADRRLDAARLMLEMPGVPESKPPAEGLFFAEDDPWIDDDGHSAWCLPRTEYGWYTTGSGSSVLMKSCLPRATCGPARIRVRHSCCPFMRPTSRA